MRRLWWLIPHLKIEMWGNGEGGSFVGERGGRLRGASGIGVPSTTLRTGSSRSKDALRMTAENKQRRRTGNGKGEMRGFFAAFRMTTPKRAAPE
jgi:hypothetical protein